MRHASLCGLIVLLLAMPTAGDALEDQNLPLLGDSMSGIVSLDQERKLGQAFLRSLRAQVKTISDPLLKDYLEYLIYHLAEHSQLRDRRLELVILDSRQLNAFAVPGGIVGINLGLFLYAETSSEFAAILAHELAHISQRHYARSSESARQNSLISLAGVLASVILIATTGADAGMAAMTTTQGLAQQAALRNSRAKEAEADRVGITTLAEADMDPRAMAYMFERLSRINRFSGEGIPDFLLTHPVTQARIADSYNQTAHYANKMYPPDLNYLLMRARVLVMDEKSPDISVKRMQDGLKSADDVSRVAYRYGLVLALIKASRTKEAQLELDKILASHRDMEPLLLAQVEIDIANNNPGKARATLERELTLNPGNFPVSMQYVSLLQTLKEYKKAVSVLETQVAARPRDADVWYELAEVYGQVRDIPKLHQARAEFFVLNGNLEQAIKQLEYALPLVADNFHDTARITQRLQEIQELKKQDLDK